MWKLLTSWPLYKQSYRPLSVSATLQMDGEHHDDGLVDGHDDDRDDGRDDESKGSPDDNEAMVIGQNMLLWGKSNRVPAINQHDH